MHNFTLLRPAVRLKLAMGGFQIIDMLRDVGEEPLFRAVSSPHDNPNSVLDHDVREMALEAAKRTSPRPSSTTPLAAIDPSQHADLRTHGAYLAHGAGPGPQSMLVPQFSYSVTPLHADILEALPITVGVLVEEGGRIRLVALAAGVGSANISVLDPPVDEAFGMFGRGVGAGGKEFWAQGPDGMDFQLGDDEDWDDGKGKRLSRG
ncbi:hypothetical protein C8R45DRAFT_1100837 [Mycena sanguinolenta]|nr:hypothetical protein C8R45DRAFT_1100837 [Mycena sanguinolenta]